MTSYEYDVLLISTCCYVIESYLDPLRNCSDLLPVRYDLKDSRNAIFTSEVTGS